MLAKKKSDADKFNYYSFNVSVLSTGLWAPVSRQRRFRKVEVRGLEPLTPWLQTMCSAS
jgi:hypothetical protein